MTQRSCLSIILAAGEGTRMKSAKPKVLHEIAGLPMVAHVAAAAKAAGGTDVALVVGHGADEVRKAAARLDPAPEIFVQEQRLGTGHAVLAARAAIARGYDDILVMFGDTPLIEAEALLAARKKLAEGAAVVVVGFRPADPAGYGRLIEKGGKLVAIREDKDASEAEKKIGFCNGGLMAISGSHALGLARSQSATRTPRANITSPTSSRSPTRGALRSSPPRPAPKACSASTTAPSSPRRKASGSAAAAAKQCLPASR